MAEFEVAIIGSGPAGYVGAIHAAQKGLKTCLIEKGDALGGTCLNVGCIPSKALLHASEIISALEEEGSDWGISAKGMDVNFSKMMHKKQEIIDKLTGGIDYLMKKNKVEKIIGTATFLDAKTLQVGDRVVKAERFIIATGSAPIELPFLPFDEKRILSSTGALSLTSIPKKLIVVGGGVIGLELGSFYKRLGTKVEVVEFLEKIIPEYDEDVSSVYQRILERQGIAFHLGAKVTGGEVHSKGMKVTASTKEGEKTFDADHVLVCIGRKPYAEGLGLDKAGVKVSDRGFVEVDGNFRTSVDSIFAVGDVIGGAMLAHKGSHEAICAIDHFLGKKTKMNYAAVPGVIYSSPEVASVGALEKDLKEKGVSYKVVKFPFTANSRYVAIGGKDPCFVKYLVCKETNKLFGASIIGPHAGELIGEPTLAISCGLTLDKLAHTIHAHPTFSEALHEAALGGISSFLHM
ncbi:dihydrolipoyl dehydrogenase [bacterium]|nr:dihydrolipoyl dehydrogenase [bacterium]